MITGAPKGFLMENASEEGIDATMITSGPPGRTDTDDEDIDGGETMDRDSLPTPDDEEDDDAPTVDGAEPADGPTVQRDFRDKPKRSGIKRNVPAPAALSAKIQAPAVSELRKPRASRKTPGAGTPIPNVLQALVGQGGGAEMPRGPRTEDSSAQTLPERPAVQVPQQMPPGYAADASGMPLAAQQVQLPPPGYGGYGPQGYPQQYPQQPYQYPPGYPQQQQMSPGALYQLTPYGAPPPQPMSLTGQMRLFEVDEMPSQYRLGSGAARGVRLAIAAVLAVSVAAAVTFFVIRSTKDMAPTFGTIKVESVPLGAEVSYDGTKLAGVTPMTIDKVPLGTRHEIKVELARHKAFVDSVDIPKDGGDVQVNALMKPITGKLVVNTTPANAEIWIDNQLRGRAPTTLSDIDMATAKVVELKLKDYQPYTQKLEWPANGEIDIDRKLQK
jgi:hypothetical protein